MRAPGGTVGGSAAASPGRQDLHACGAPCEPAAAPGAGGPVQQPAARRPARPSRDTHGRSWSAPPATTAPGPLRPSSAVMLLEQEVVSEIHAPHRWIALPRLLARILALPVNQVLAANALPAPDRAAVLPLVARPAAVRRDGGHKSGAGCC